MEYKITLTLVIDIPETSKIKVFKDTIETEIYSRLYGLNPVRNIIREKIK